MESVKVVPNIIRTLGAIPKRMEEYVRNINAGIELAALKGAVSRNLAKLGNYKMPVKLRET